MGTTLTYRHEDGINWNLVMPDLIVGSCLQGPEDADRLAAAGVTTVFSLQVRWRVAADSSCRAPQRATPQQPNQQRRTGCASRMLVLRQPPAASHLWQSVSCGGLLPPPPCSIMCAGVGARVCLPCRRTATWSTLALRLTPSSSAVRRLASSTCASLSGTLTPSKWGACSEQQLGDGEA